MSHAHGSSPDGPYLEVFADIGCPFTHVGLRRLVARRSELGRGDVRLWVRAWPLERVNGKPLDRDFIAEEVGEIRDQVASDLFCGFRTAAFPETSIPALGLTAAAYAADPAKGEAVALGLRDALFEQGLDIADESVLSRLAAAFGIAQPDQDAATALVEADWAEGRARGVVGSPHFFTADGDFFCPSLNVSRDGQGHLRVTADPDGFDSFVTAALGAA